MSSVYVFIICYLILSNLLVLRYLRIVLARPDAMRIEAEIERRVASGEKITVAELDMAAEPWIRPGLRKRLGSWTVLALSLDGDDFIQVNDGLEPHRVLVICHDCEAAFYAVTTTASGAPRMLRILDKVAPRSSELVRYREAAIVRLANMGKGRDLAGMIRKRVEARLK